VSALREGYNVTIVAEDTGKAEEIRDLGLKFIDLPMNSVGMNPFEDMKTLIFLCKLYKKEKPDIVHHVGLKSILWGTLAAKKVKINGIVNAISGLGIFFSEENKPILSRLIKSLLKYSHNRRNVCAIFQNNEDKELFLKDRISDKSKIDMIKGSGVNLNEFKYTPEPDNDPVKIVFMARMVRDKGVFELVEAAELLREGYENKVQFLLCGGLHPNPTSLKKEDFDRICDGKYIIWLGHRTDVKNILEQSHIVTLPSYYKEGLPKSLIEGTAIGRPIVTTDSIGCRDAVIDGYNGFIIPVKNGQALAEKLKVLIDDKDLRVNMGKNSRDYAEKNFSLDVVIDRQLSVYNRLISKS
jgi:glycosyltransferase involved in cell wall biosynthesis